MKKDEFIYLYCAVDKKGDYVDGRYRSGHYTKNIKYASLWFDKIDAIADMTEPGEKVIKLKFKLIGE